jgi:hypothetical protein
VLCSLSSSICGTNSCEVSGINEGDVADVLNRYNAYIEQQALKKTYRYDGADKHNWTEEDKRRYGCSRTYNVLITGIRFIVAYNHFGNGPRSNKRIADFIGNGA